jgi:hypothetical protein
MFRKSNNTNKQTKSQKIYKEVPILFFIHRTKARKRGKSSNILSIEITNENIYTTYLQGKFQELIIYQQVIQHF